MGVDGRIELVSLVEEAATTLGERFMLYQMRFSATTGNFTGFYSNSNYPQSWGTRPGARPAARRADARGKASGSAGLEKDV